MKNLFRKVAFGLKPDEQISSDPLTWAQKQIETVPELNWKGKYILSEGICSSGFNPKATFLKKFFISIF